MTWEDYSEFERWLNVAQFALDQAKKAVKDEDDSLFRKFVQQTQDAEVVEETEGEEEA